MMGKNRVKWVQKGWGGEKWIDNNDLYCGKLLIFMKGLQCSVHYHLEKIETFYVHAGSILVRYHDSVEELKRKIAETGIDKIYDHMDKIVLEQGDTFFVPQGRVHQMLALEDSEMFEFSTHHDDLDSVRLLKGD